MKVNLILIPFIDVIDENTDEKEPVKRYGFLVLGNINNNATKQEVVYLTSCKIMFYSTF